MKTLTFYTRDGCHLCDEALAALARVRETKPFHLVICDLDRDAPDEKRAAYDWDIPVMELNGRKVMKHRVDIARLLRLLSE